MLIGKRTYDWVVSQGHGFHHAERETFVVTRQEIPATDNITFYSGDLELLISKLKAKNGKDIFCDGGAQLVHQLMKDGLIDRIVLSIIPIVLGGGIRLFAEGIQVQKLILGETKTFESGLVQLNYLVSK
ncbi:dihydrofolate reductase family protein [Myroides pelagicus]|uniref:dihydrofolate reductase family protein n=1 Tax=Myroides pelagicus TaxID=270914 RepID=UPI0029390A7F|nr:dihydrofolate reductase family protein [Myroides pelagicus]MEC4113643.1 dihydrofolate reductase family protein [Myroides pelagicus]